MTAPATHWNLPNLMTLARLASIPFFVVVFYLPFAWSDICAAAIFLLAGLTDALDGYLARRLKQTSRFGAFLDPVADKLIVAAALVMLVDEHANLWIVVPAIVIISREITVSALREWMAEVGARARVAVSWVGKVKTVMQISAITALLAARPTYDESGAMEMTLLLWVGYLLLMVATVLTLWSMLNYLAAARPELLPAKKGQ